MKGLLTGASTKKGYKKYMLKDKNVPTEQDYWNSFYKEWSFDIPSQFCVLAATEIPRDHAIVEFGCGNGRDSLYFAEQNFSIVAMDLSSEAIKKDKLAASKNKGKLLTFMQGDVSNENDVLKALNTAREASSSGQITVYTRFFLHTLDEKQEAQFIDTLVHNLKKNDKIYFEFRATEDKNESKIYSDHYRRFIDVEVLTKILKANLDTKETYVITGKGMAKFKQEDPIVANIYRPDKQGSNTSAYCGFKLSITSNSKVPTNLLSCMPKDSRITVMVCGAPLGYKSNVNNIIEGRSEDNKELAKKITEGWIVNKDGWFIPSLKAKGDKWALRVFKDYRTAKAILKENFGYDLCVAYGTLLGLVRDNALIGHDDDIDTFYISRKTKIEDVINESHDIYDTFISLGYRVDRLNNGLMQIFISDVGRFDLFTSWFDEETFHLFFAVISREIKKQDIFPVKSVNFMGGEVYIPAKSEKLLESTYGKNWMTPDPMFQWRVNEKTKSFFYEFGLKKSLKEQGELQAERITVLEGQLSEPKALLMSLQEQLLMNSENKINSIQSIGILLYTLVSWPFMTDKKYLKLKEQPRYFFRDSKNLFTLAVGSVFRIK